MQNYAKYYKALGDSTRFQIVQMLKGGQMCACKILQKFNITQPTLSYHMKSLVGCGLVIVDKKGVWNHYSLNVELLRQLADALDKQVTIE